MSTNHGVEKKRESLIKRRKERLKKEKVERKAEPLSTERKKTKKKGDLT